MARKKKSKGLRGSFMLTVGLMIVSFAAGMLTQKSVFREPQTDIMLPEMQLQDSGAVTGRQLADSMQGMSRIFDVVRLVDPKRGEILQLNPDGTFSDRVLPCFPVCNLGKRGS